MKSRVPVLFWLKIGLMLAASVMIRPTAMGQSMTILAIVLTVIAFGCHIAESGRKSLSFPVTNLALTVMILVTFMWIYFCVHAVLNVSRHIDYVAKGAIAHVTLILAFGVILSDEKSQRAYFKGFIILITLPIISYIVTMMLSHWKSYESLYLGRFLIKGYDESGDSGSMYFPLTPVYSFVNLGGTTLPRLLDVFRESGIAQAFFAWAFIATNVLWNRALLIRILLVFGMIATISTVAMALLPLILFLGVINRSRTFNRASLVTKAVILVALTSGIGYGALKVVADIPYIGLNDKDKYTVSVSDRKIAAQQSIDAIQKEPLGKGLYNTEQQNVGINLIGSMALIGIPGAILYALAYLVPAFVAKDTVAHLSRMAPIFITCLFSQPLIDAPLVYLLLLLNLRAPEASERTSFDRPARLRAPRGLHPRESVGV